MPNSRRKNGDGSVIYNKNGTVSIRITIGKNINGGYKTKSFTGKNYKDAKRKLDYYRRKQNIFSQQTGESEPLGASMEIWLKDFHRNKISIQTYARYLETFKKIDKEFGFYRIYEITATMIQDHINRLNDNYKSHSEMAKILSLIRIYYRYLMSIQVVTYDPTAGVSLPNSKTINKKTKQVTALTQEDKDKFLETAFSLFKNGKPRYRYRFVYLFLLNTGLRISELTALYKSDVDLINKEVHINTSVSMVNKNALGSKQVNNAVDTKYVYFLHEPKSSTSKRVVPLNKTALFAAENILQYCTTKDSLLFVSNQDGSIVNVRELDANIKAICKRAGLPAFGVHVLRHTFGTNLSNSGVPDREIADLLGHAYTTVTQKYIHKNTKDLHLAVDCLDTPKS